MQTVTTENNCGIEKDEMIDMTDHLFPLENVIKKVGNRFYQGNRRQFRFFPLSKKAFEKLDQSKYEIYEKIGEDCFVKIN